MPDPRELHTDLPVLVFRDTFEHTCQDLTALPRFCHGPFSCLPCWGPRVLLVRASGWWVQPPCPHPVPTPGDSP